THAREQLNMEDYLDWIAAWPANKRPKYARIAAPNPSYLVELYQASKESKKQKPQNIPTALRMDLDSEESDNDQCNGVVKVTPGTNDAEASSSKAPQSKLQNP
ncbi:hypothetical protein MKW92_006245, partial [Papaver armeniacum]